MYGVGGRIAQAYVACKGAIHKADASAGLESINGNSVCQHGIGFNDLLGLIRWVDYNATMKTYSVGCSAGFA